MTRLVITVRDTVPCRHDHDPVPHRDDFTVVPKGTIGRIIGEPWVGDYNAEMVPVEFHVARGSFPTGDLGAPDPDSDAMLRWMMLDEEMLCRD